MQGKFQKSLNDIKTKIKEHESRYSKVVEENDMLKKKISNFVEYDQKRIEDFETYKSHCSKLEEITEKEKNSFREVRNFFPFF